MEEAHAHSVLTVHESANGFDGLDEYDTPSARDS
jgi:hypothetical protein